MSPQTDGVSVSHLRQGDSDLLLNVDVGFLTFCFLSPSSRDVVLGVPVVSFLLALHPQCCGAADVGDAAAPQTWSTHHHGDGQHGIPGLPVWGGHHQ